MINRHWWRSVLSLAPPIPCGARCMSSAWLGFKSGSSVISGKVSSKVVVDSSSSCQILSVERLLLPLILHQDVRFKSRKYFKKTQSIRFDGHIDVYDKNGEREAFQPAVERFKRLNWGYYIHNVRGRDAPRYKTRPEAQWGLEQHIGAMKVEVELLEKMFSCEMKRCRYFPDDPYEKYNRMPFWKHHWNKLKNSELIRKHGNNVYAFNRYKAHLSNPKHLEKIEFPLPNEPEKLYYEPPDYYETVNSNPAGVYCPDPDQAPPKVVTAPFFQRRQHKHPSEEKKLKEVKKIRNLEEFNGKLPVFSPVWFKRKYVQ